MSQSEKELPISEDLLEILRDPAAVQEPEKYGPDPGKLELVHNSWLVSADTGYKYPIRDGIPVMLIEEGERWKDTPIEDLPMPPESIEPLAAPISSGPDLFPETSGSGGVSYAVLAGGLLLFALLVVLLIGRKSSEADDESTPD